MLMNKHKNITPISVREYHVFIAAPSDVYEERTRVRAFFDENNKLFLEQYNIRFQVIDFENNTTIGVGRPQELITKQTLEKYQNSLALIIGIMGQKFGSPTGTVDSGTEEEFNWAFDFNKKNGFPEIKWFFKKFQKIMVPEDIKEAYKALEQWNKVKEFKNRLNEIIPKLYYSEYQDLQEFENILRNDLNLWVNSHERPWKKQNSTSKLRKPNKEKVLSLKNYYQKIYDELHALDMAGIDTDRAFEIPLSDIYVRLKVAPEEKRKGLEGIAEDGTIELKEIVKKYDRVVIVGDPGSGKSTFVKYITLMIARSELEKDENIALELLNLVNPLPVPILINCWELSDYLKTNDVNISSLTNYIYEKFNLVKCDISFNYLINLLDTGKCFLLFDGLDEVPTEKGRIVVRELIEDFIKKYKKNKYIVTCRIRAYTKEAILKEGFLRCDLQNFNEADRHQFLINWFALLMKQKITDVTKIESKSNYELQELTKTIELNERIKTLALNPLLLTVIAIVHRNRSRLPEQRVDLYDQCIDVLLGQRKEAEHIRITPKNVKFDEKQEQIEYEDRSWIRKRFADIALAILNSNDEEIKKTEVIKILTPKFNKIGDTEEDAICRAELFLDRQELKSGLLINRRTGYRFVHQSFEEYLTAWNLSNKSYEEVTKIIYSHLREQKWFETLQLLGDEWAKNSDENINSYINWLLDNKGKDIQEIAPIVALCANIVEDIKGVADLNPPIMSLYKKEVSRTLEIFKDTSRVSEKTQLEILEALARLGPTVKNHLMNATKSKFYTVRKRAINVLLPHLSTIELFKMDHILKDPSKRPIYIYLDTLWRRDPVRTIKLLEGKKILDGLFKIKKVGNTEYISIGNSENYRIFQAVAHLFWISDSKLEESEFLISCWDLIWYYDAKFIEGFETRMILLHSILKKYPHKRDTRLHIQNMALSDQADNIRIEAMDQLVKHYKNHADVLKTLIKAGNEKDWHYRRPANHARYLLNTVYSYSDEKIIDLCGQIK